MLYILLSHKTGWNNDICSNMNGPTDYQTKSSKSDKDKCHMISLICVIFKKWHKRTYLQNGNRLTDIKNKHGYQRGKNGRDKSGILD